MTENLFPPLHSSSWDQYNSTSLSISFTGDYSCSWTVIAYNDYLRYKVRDGSLNGKTLKLGFDTLITDDNLAGIEVYLYDASNETYTVIDIYQDDGIKEKQFTVPPDGGDVVFYIRHAYARDTFPSTNLFVDGVYLYDTNIDSTVVLNFHKVLKQNMPTTIENGTEHIYFTTDGSSVEMYISTKEGYLVPVGGQPSPNNVDYNNVYTQQHIDERINKIKSLTQGDYISFVIATDVHVKPITEDISRYNQVKDLLMVTKQLPIDYIACCGDLLAFEETFEIREPRLTMVSEILKNCSSPFYITRGNHDYNSFVNQLLNVQNKIWYNDVSKFMYETNGHKIVNPRNNPINGYFYVDDEINKHRMIYINMFESHTDNHGNPYFDSSGVGNFSLSGCRTKQQIDWLVNEALILNDKTDWIVSFYGHMIPYTDDEFHNYGEDNIELRQLIKAFQNGTNVVDLQFTSLDLDTHQWGYHTVNVDFSQQGAIPVVGFFAGHVHDDCYKKVDGLNLFVSTCTGSSQRTVWDNDTTPTKLPPERNEGNLSMSLNLFIIQKSTRIVNVIKLGSKRNNSVIDSSDYTFTY